MKIILDTHAFIWWDSAPDKLSDIALDSCKDPDNQLILSVASIWEIQIKANLGKIKLNTNLRGVIESQQAANDLSLLPVKSPHVYELDNLPIIHKDPFDRLIIAQARVEGAVLLTHDSVLKQYPVEIHW